MSNISSQFHLLTPKLVHFVYIPEILSTRDLKRLIQLKCPEVQVLDLSITYPRRRRGYLQAQVKCTHAQHVIRALNGHDVLGRKLVVDWVREDQSEKEYLRIIERQRRRNPAEIPDYLKEVLEIKTRDRHLRKDSTMESKDTEESLHDVSEYASTTSNASTCDNVVDTTKDKLEDFFHEIHQDVDKMKRSDETTWMNMKPLETI